MDFNDVKIHFYKKNDLFKLKNMLDCYDEINVIGLCLIELQMVYNILTINHFILLFGLSLIRL